jgi:hypothetical protein
MIYLFFFKRWLMCVEVLSLSRSCHTYIVSPPPPPHIHLPSADEHKEPDKDNDIAGGGWGGGFCKVCVPELIFTRTIHCHPACCYRARALYILSALKYEIAFEFFLAVR